ncbi:MAG: 5-formyltetrahydrofolate cyclo-ligase [Chlorobiota bacterium]|jgi:5-formyltetrahydrofolate cyclo-ligase|nr:MAG: 5-formyltetrahydrofolate cyclo-ligase [Chlorobiota bacterium]
MTKAEIRRRLIAARGQLSPTERQEYSLAIAEHLWAQPEYIMARALHVYLPIRGEVDTQPIIERAWSEGKSVIVPVLTQGASELAHAVLTAASQRTEGLYGIPVPADAPLLSAAELEASAPLVLVPLVAFDRMLYRVGYGKGYYDRFLSSVPFVRFGLAYAMQFVEEIPREEHDQQLDAVITELGVVRR